MFWSVFAPFPGLPGNPGKSVSVHLSLEKLCQPVVFWKQGLELLSNVWNYFAWTCHVWNYMKMSETNKKMSETILSKVKISEIDSCPKTLQMILYRTLLATCTVPLLPLIWVKCLKTSNRECFNGLRLPIVKRCPSAANFFVRHFWLLARWCLRGHLKYLKQNV
jgi:hypothetical protein